MSLSEKSILSPEDSEWPILLSLIEKPPEKLYCLGDRGLLTTLTVAVVGARRCSEYGKWAAYNIARRLSEHGVTVVSGMAEGIDSCAHKGALDGGTPTVAVWGCGLDYCFPRHNEGLMRRIAERGLIITEYPEGIRPNKFTFPQRNRIISGISFAVVVAEAGIKSGSLITAEFAAEQGREVYAVPGNINRHASVGCNKLIYDGAKPILFIDDVLKDMGIETGSSRPPGKGLSECESRAVEVVRKNGELGYDEFAGLTRMSLADATSLAVLLEMKGLVDTASGKIMPV